MYKDAHTVANIHVMLLMAKRFGRVKTYEEWIKPIIVENSVELLERNSQI